MFAYLLFLACYLVSIVVFDERFDEVVLVAAVRTTSRLHATTPLAHNYCYTESRTHDLKTEQKREQKAGRGDEDDASQETNNTAKIGIGHGFNTQSRL
jgi:hypothetical protein